MKIFVCCRFVISRNDLRGKIVPFGLQITFKTNYFHNVDWDCDFYSFSIPSDSPWFRKNLTAQWYMNGLYDKYWDIKSWDGVPRPMTESQHPTVYRYLYDSSFIICKHDSDHYCIGFHSHQYILYFQLTCDLWQGNITYF